MIIELDYVRPKLDKKARELIAGNQNSYGLKQRSAYSLNKRVFIEERSEGVTWFQHEMNVRGLNFPEKGNIVNFGKEILDKLCKKGEDSDKYEEVSQANVDVFYTLFSRISMGIDVARAKMQKEPSLVYMIDKDDIRQRLTYAGREREVIDKGISIAKEAKLPDPDIAKWIFRRIIDMTLDVQVGYIWKEHERLECCTTGPWGCASNKYKSQSKGWSK
jgi:chorismate mutase|tara:strand:- start:1373 stop:2026 length:654 start_codon:yes stop_codon:yes gene_type:complete